jgi:hypothetical protein
MFPTSIAEVKTFPAPSQIPAASGGNILSGTAFTADTVLVNAPIIVPVSGGIPTAVWNVRIIDQSKQNQPVDLYFYSSKPAEALTSNVALAETVVDAEVYIGKISVAAGTVFTNESVQAAIGAGVPLLVLPKGKALYVIPVLTGAGTPTFVANKPYEINFDVSVY